jgi:CheY-like chemotaxis protein
MGLRDYQAAEPDNYGGCHPGTGSSRVRLHKCTEGGKQRGMKPSRAYVTACGHPRIGQNLYNWPLVLICTNRGSTLAKILVVDDDPVTQVTVRRVLEQAGHAVVVTDDGAEGLARFRAETFDLVIPDIFMPSMDGFETMRRVLQQRPDLLIIMTSGRPSVPESMQEPDYLTMATKLGAVHALPKPFKPAALLAMVADCLAQVSPSLAQSRPDRDAVPNS